MASPKKQSIKEATEKSPMTSSSPPTQALEEAIRKSPQKSSSLPIHAREETNEKYSLKPSPQWNGILFMYKIVPVYHKLL